jgi:hypothetical protein
MKLGKQTSVATIGMILATSAAAQQPAIDLNASRGSASTVVVSTFRFSQLMRYCTSPDADKRVLCRTYVIGALDYQAADDAERKRPPTLCRPVTTEWTAAIDAIIRRLEEIYRAQPMLHQTEAGIGVQYAAKELFTCRRRSQVEFRPSDWEERAGLSKIHPPQAKEPIFVAPDALLTSRDVAAVSVRREPNETYVDIEFNEDGARIFRAWSSLSTGRSLAIFIDDKFVAAPIVLGGGSGNKFAVTGKNMSNIAPALVKAFE